MDDFLKRGTKKVKLIVTGDTDANNAPIFDVYLGAPKAMLKAICFKYKYPFNPKWGTKRNFEKFKKLNGSKAEYLTIIQVDCNTPTKLIT